MGKDLKYGTIYATRDDDDSRDGVAIQDLASEVGAEGEPVIVFRAQDKLSVPLLARYENLYVATQPDSFDADTDPFVIGVRTVREEFQKWQSANPDKVKLPD